MKILQIATYYLPHYGGIEQVVSDFNRILKKAGHQTKIICFNDNSKTIVDVYDNQEVIRVGYKYKLSSQAISFRYYFELKKIIRHFNPDVIHIHLPNPLISMYLLLLNPKCKITLHWHSDIIRQKILKRIYYPFEKKLLNRADKIIATTKIYAENSDRISKYLHKVTVIPPIIDDAFLDSKNPNDKNLINEIKSTYLNKKIIFSIGVHREYKGLRYLIDAAQYISDDFIIIIAGSGPLTDGLKRQVADLKLNNIIFIGRITNEEKRIYLLASDIYAFPSITKNEAFGIALAEALYCGIPAVTFTIDGSGVNYVNKDGVTGIEVKSINAKDYAKALLQVSKSKYGLNAHNWIQENFTEKAITKNVVDFFNEVNGDYRNELC